MTGTDDSPPVTATPDPATRQNQILADLAYHLELSVRLAAAGEADEAASETALALALLRSSEERTPGELWSDLPSHETRPPSQEGHRVIVRRAHALALEIQAHYVSEGRHELAAAYASAASRLVP